MAIAVKDAKRAVRTTSILEGPNIYLRKIVVFDVNETYMRWMNDDMIVQYLEVRHMRRSMKDLREYVAGVIENKQDAFFAICLNETGRHIGNIKLGPINKVHGFASVGFLIGERDQWGKGLATEAVNLVTRYAFETLGLRRVTAGCYATNEASLRVFKKAGFKKEVVLVSQWFSNGKYVDGILLGKMNPKLIKK